MSILIEIVKKIKTTDKEKIGLKLINQKDSDDVIKYIYDRAKPISGWAEWLLKTDGYLKNNEKMISFNDDLYEMMHSIMNRFFLRKHWISNTTKFKIFEYAHPEKLDETIFIIQLK